MARGYLFLFRGNKWLTRRYGFPLQDDRVITLGQQYRDGKDRKVAGKWVGGIKYKMNLGWVEA